MSLLRAPIQAARILAGATLVGGETALGLGRAMGDVVSSTVAAAALGAAQEALTVAQTGMGMLAEAAGANPARRVSARANGRWIEVRGLDTHGETIAAAVRDALSDVPGVNAVHINGPTGRAVVVVADGGPSAPRLAAVVARAEAAVPSARPASPRPLSLPGDDTLLIGRAVATAVSSVGFGAAAIGALLPVKGVSRLLSAPVAVADYHPRVRRAVEDRLGPEGADLAFACVGAVTGTLTISPAALLTSAATRAMYTAEALNGRRAWGRMATRLTELAGKTGDVVTARSADQARHAKTGARFAEWSAGAGLGAAAVLGVTATPAAAAGAALVGTPKPVRTVREAFACAISRGLHSIPGCLVMRPPSLRWIGDVDTIVIDPRILFTDELTVSRVRGLDNSARAAAWSAAVTALESGSLTPGWNAMSAIPGGGDTGEALVSAVRDPLAAALVTEARRAGTRVISIADDGLHSLGQGFDELRPRGSSVDEALAGAVAGLRAGGATVALLCQGGTEAILGADLTIGVIRDGDIPPWGSDILVPDLAAAWRVLRVLPAAREAADKGVSMSAGSSVLGTLMLIPGVPGSGPASVDLTALAGLWSGFTLGRKVFREPLPHPESGHEWHSLPVGEVARLLPQPPPEVADSGLGSVRRLLESPPVRRTRGRLGSLAGSIRDYVDAVRDDLSDPITPILATGAAASALLGSPLDAVMVGGVLVLNAAISAQQTVHAEHVLRRLLAVQEPLARRLIGGTADGRVEAVPAGRLRVGDLVEVRAGEVVPADGRIVGTAGVEVDESALTGESLPVAKNTEATPGAPMADRTGMLYAGSTVVAGAAVAIVTAAGPATQVNRALAMSPVKSGEVGLAAQLRKITRRALPFSLSGGGLVGVLSLLRGTPVRETASHTVSIAVAAVPEGLPLVVTLAQSASARGLTGSSVLIRNPRAIEAFARLDAVCFDKTGTLSENKLRVISVRALDGVGDDDVLTAAVRTMLVTEGRRADHATDQAVREAAAQLAIAPGSPDAFLPFQSDRPFAAALVGDRVFVKGAPETVLDAAASGDAAVVSTLQTALEEMAADGLRVLAVAQRRVNRAQARAAAADPDALAALCGSGLTPLGLIGLADTPRAQSRALLEELQARGIQVRLITGDHPVTAAVIAKQLGVAVTAAEVLTGAQWEALSAPERRDAAARFTVFARMSPEHKVEVVQALESAGLVTAMVGDGANDAAAIRAATVGVGVVSTGSDPARMAADVMLLDGQIGALVDALDEGQQLWRRVQSAVSVLLGHNVGELSFALITSLLTGRPALNARQMLLVNMLTDALPAAALAVSPQTGTAGGAGYDEATIWRAVALRGVFTTLGATLAWAMARLTGRPRRAATVGLIGLVLSQMLETLSDSHGPLVVATNIGTVLVMGAIISTPGVSQVFGCTPVGPIGWAQAIVAALAAGGVSALLPAVVQRIADRIENSVLDGQNADTDEDRVDVFEGGRQQPHAGVDEGVGAQASHDIAHAAQLSPVPAIGEGLPN